MEFSTGQPDDDPANGRKMVNEKGKGKGKGKGKRPQQTKFMFIDASDKGTNAKPDKAVRSFVMHQARRSKTWSTRQKQILGDEVPSRRLAGPSPKRSPSQPHSKADRTPSSRSQDLDFDPNVPSTWSARAFGSPVSSDSFSANSRESSQPSTPGSSHGSVCNIPSCTGASCGWTHDTTVARRDGFALGALDPFDCLAVKFDAKSSALLDHFASMLSPRLLPVDLHQSSNTGTSQWLANSLRNVTSAPFTYAILTSSALHLSTLGGASPQDALYYKAQSISEINKLLADSKTSIDDNNISAVFTLLCLEESQLAPGNQSPDEAAWSEMQRSFHLNGLRTMIQQRGGLSALSDNRCLQTFLLMHSMAHAISTFQRPYTALLDSTGQVPKYDIPLSRPHSASTRIFSDLGLDPELSEIVSTIVVFTGDMSSWYEDKICPVDALELQRHECLLTYRLFDWYTTHVSDEGDDQDTRSPVEQSICLALLIFILKISHPFDPIQALILTPVKKLRAALSKSSLSSWAKSPDLLLWTLTIGSLAAQGTAELSFFTQYSFVAFAHAGLTDKTSAEELIRRMKTCLWVPWLLDEEATRLWAKTGLVRGRVDEQIDDGMISPEIREDVAVGMLTSHRFFTENR